QDDELEYDEADEAVDGRCAAVLSAGRRCPNASLPGSRYCGLPQHQALARFETNQVTVLGALSEQEVATLADPDADESALRQLVERAEAAFSEESDEEEAEVAPEEPAEEEPAEAATHEDQPTAATGEAGAERQEPAEEPDP